MRSIHRLGVAAAATAAVVLAGCDITAPASPTEPTYEIRITYRAAPNGDVAPSDDDLEMIRAIVERRIQDTGVAALRVTALAPDLVVVETAPASVADDLRPLVGATGQMDLVPLGRAQLTRGQRVDLEAFPPLFSGDQVVSAAVGVDQAGRPAVDLRLDDDARRLFADYTSRNIGAYVAVVLDGVAMSVPAVNEAVLDGAVQISVGIDAGPAEAQRLVTVLRYGPLPFPIEEIAVERL